MHLKMYQNGVQWYDLSIKNNHVSVFHNIAYSGEWKLILKPAIDKSNFDPCIGRLLVHKSIDRRPACRVFAKHSVVVAIARNTDYILMEGKFPCCQIITTAGMCGWWIMLFFKIFAQPTAQKWITYGQLYCVGGRNPIPYGCTYAAIQQESPPTQQAHIHIKMWRCAFWCALAATQQCTARTIPVLFMGPVHTKATLFCAT